MQLQHLTEKQDADFIIASHNRALAGAVTATDRLLVLAEGMVCDPDIAKAHLADKANILALPADSAVPLGFERIDRDRAWAGAMIIRGALVEKLHDFPDDIDCVSSLLRLGLQSGSQISLLDGDYLTANEWGLITNQVDLAEWRSRAISRSMVPASWKRPIYAGLDRLVMRKAASAGLPGGMSAGLRAGAIVAIVAAIALAFSGFVAGGMVTLAIAAMLSRGGESAGLVAIAAADASRRKRLAELAELLTLDSAIMLALFISVPTDTRVDIVFAAVMLLGLLHFSSLQGPPVRIPLLQDRAVLALIAAGGLIFSVILHVIQMLALFALAVELSLAIRARLTGA